MSSDNSTQNSERNDSYDVVGRLTSDQEAMQALSRAMWNRGVPDEQVMPGVTPGNAARASQSRNQAVSNESGNEASNESYEGHTWITPTLIPTVTQAGITQQPTTPSTTTTMEQCDWQPSIDLQKEDKGGTIVETL